jgi:hypothetical protein
LADLPDPAGLFHLASNRISNNTKACAAGEDIPFPLSGVSVALLGATGHEGHRQPDHRKQASADT